MIRWVLVLDGSVRPPKPMFAYAEPWAYWTHRTLPPPIDGRSQFHCTLPPQPSVPLRPFGLCAALKSPRVYTPVKRSRLFGKIVRSRKSTLIREPGAPVDDAPFDTVAGKPPKAVVLLSLRKYATPSVGPLAAVSGFPPRPKSAPPPVPDMLTKNVSTMCTSARP